MKEREANYMNAVARRESDCTLGHWWLSWLSRLLCDAGGCEFDSGRTNTHCLKRTEEKVLPVHLQMVKTFKSSGIRPHLTTLECIYNCEDYSLSITQSVSQHIVNTL